MISLEPHYLQHLSHTSDKDVILRDLMKAYGEDVWHYAFFITRKADAADDISQEVFLTVYERMFTFRGECSVKSWLLSITRNKSMNLLRSFFLRKVTLVGEVFLKETSPSAESVVFERMQTHRIWKKVMSLPRKFREIVVLDAYYLFTSREIAELLRIPEATVRTRLYRARRKMTAMLEAETDGGDTR
ncbi:sigma-70 family RNA polymerase sigma factor [Paenibacillus filicis]|uniref:Sigma-70 family RNA polymerase sigma factor n=1 Tax=Paenibacillus filicis TaxID=669464 RepID=A0ABU9DHV3_9BACL